MMPEQAEGSAQVSEALQEQQQVLHAQQQQQALQQLPAQLGAIQAQLDAMQAQVAGIDARLVVIDARLDNVRRRAYNLRARGVHNSIFAAPLRPLRRELQTAAGNVAVGALPAEGVFPATCAALGMVGAGRRRPTLGPRTERY